MTAPADPRHVSPTVPPAGTFAVPGTPDRPSRIQDPSAGVMGSKCGGMELVTWAVPLRAVKLGATVR